MADFSALKQSIEIYIKNNGNKEITGAILQNILLSMVTTMGDGAINDNASDISDIKGDIQNINGSITDINGDITEINGAITNINGDITDLNGDLSDEKNRAEGAEGTLQQNITAEKNRAEGAETTTILFSDGKLVFKNAAGTVLYQLSVDSFLNAITTRLNTGALYAGYATPSTTPAALTSQEVFYLATQAGTYTNFHFNGGDDPIVLTKDGIYFIVSGNDDDDWNAEPMLQLDDVPTASSNNAVKSGGVAEELALGAVYDVSAKNPTAGPNNDGKWESLSALMSDANLNTLIPTFVRKGGMSIKFVLSADNKYVQYRLMADDWSTNTEDWALYSEDILVDNYEFIKAVTDKDGRFLYGVRKDGEFIFGTGIPAKIKKYISDSLSEKVSKEDGKGLSTNDYTDEDKNIVSSFKVIENNEYICAIVDSSNNFIWGINKNGKIRYGAGIPTEVKNYVDRLGLTIIEEDDYLKIEKDFDDKVTKILDTNGTETIYNKTQLKGSSGFHGSIKVNNEAGNSLKESTSFNITSINALNPYDYYFPRLFNMSFKNSKSETNIKPLVICQISDIHGFTTEYNRIVDFLSLYNGIYDDVIITGDIVESHFADSIDFLNAYDNKALLEIGNHDAWERNAHPIVIVNQKQVYDKFLAPFISNWGVVQPVNTASDGKCYYYKDYPLSKIRLIVLDCMHDSQDQLDFVVSSLNGAKTLGYSVIASQHYAAGTGTPTDVPFDTLDNLGYEYNSYFVNAVDDFINEGGKFICWMCGHHHQDLFGYISGHLNQLQICIDCACDRNNYDTARIRGTKSQDSFTFYSFDTSLGIFTMLRVGATFDRHLRKKDVLVWDYVNKNIVL